MTQTRFLVTNVSALRGAAPASCSAHLSSLFLLFLQIHVIDFDDENNIINKNVLLHQAGEIWHIGASPADKAVLTTCYNKSESDCFLLSLTPVTASSDILFLYLTLFLFFLSLSLLVSHFYLPIHLSF